MIPTGIPSIEEKFLTLIQGHLQEIGIDDVVDLELPLSRLGISSLNLVRFVVGIESTFEFEFDDDEMDFHSFQSLRDLANYIARKTSS